MVKKTQLTGAQISSALDTLAAKLPAELLEKARKHDPFPLLTFQGNDTDNVGVVDFTQRVRLAEGWEKDPENTERDLKFCKLLRQREWQEKQVVILWMSPPFYPSGYIWKILVPEAVI